MIARYINDFASLFLDSVTWRDFVNRRMEKEQLEIVGPMEEPLMSNIVPEEINDLDSLSSSDSDCEKPDSPVPINAPIYRMFGRERPIHMVLGGGKRKEHSLDSFHFH